MTAAYENETTRLTARLNSNHYDFLPVYPLGTQTNPADQPTSPDWTKDDIWSASFSPDIRSLGLGFDFEHDPAMPFDHINVIIRRKKEGSFPLFLRLGCR